MSTASVSVVIPTRNRPTMVEAAVRSVLGQTRTVDQIVIVDDGSERPNADRLPTLADLSPTIEIHRVELPRGPAGARNVGLARARGDHLLFLDDDDLIHPRFVEDGLRAFAARPDADVVVFLYRCFSGPESLGDGYASSLPCESPDRVVRPVRIGQCENQVPRTVLEQHPVSAFLRYSIPIQSCLMKRSALGDCRFPEALPQGEDTYLWISLAAAGRRFVLDGRVYAFVRLHDGNITRSRRRYVSEIQLCYERLLADGLLTSPDDAFLAHLKLLWFKVLTCRPEGWRHLRPVLGSPGLLRRELVFWTANALRRWQKRFR